MLAKPPVRKLARDLGVDLASVATALHGALRPTHFALTFDGLVRVPADAVYRFVATADDGVRVTIDGARVLEDDGNHAARESAGEIALAKGKQTHDKRATEKDRDWAREKSRVMRQHNKNA